MKIASLFARAACGAWVVMVSWKPAINAFSRLHWKMTLAAVAVLVVAALGWGNYSERYAAQLNEGQAYLNIGRYNEAQGSFRQAVSLHPLRRITAIASVFGDKAGQAAQQALDLLDLGSEAQWGLDKASAFEIKDREVIWQKLDQLEKRHAGDADVHTLWGKYYLTIQEPSEAEKHFESAIKLSPKAADAYFGLCEIYDAQKNNIDLALDLCKKAIEASGTSPRPPPADYATNLAGLYVQKGRYDEAQALLKTLEDKYLFVKFELAKIYQANLHYEDAANLQNSVMKGLNGAVTVNQLDNLKAWYFKNDENIIVLPSLKTKMLCQLQSGRVFLFARPAKKAQEPFQQAALLWTENNAIIKKQLLFDLNLALKQGGGSQSG